MNVDVDLGRSPNTQSFDVDERRSEYLAKTPLEQLVSFAQQLRAEASDALSNADEIDRAVVQRMQEAGATMLDHPDFQKVALEPRIDVDIRITELLRLREIIKPDSAAAKILAKALYQPAPAPPQWRTNGTYLNQLAKLGGEVAACIKKGVVKVPNGYRLVVVPKKSPSVPIPEGPM